MDISLFGAPKIAIENIMNLEKQAPNIIVWAAPVMFLFVLVEYLVSRFQHKEHYEKKETIASILVGLGNVAIGVMIKTSLFFGFVMIYNFIPWRMELNWWTFVPCYIIFDLCSYWAHHVSHRVRFSWATHVVHHSSEHYNLTVSFRLSWIQYLKLMFFLPVALMGFHPVIIFVTNQIAVLFQFWVHTEYIRKLHPAIEFFLATPSNHRVHHGSQEKYINKNYGATFILWDRIFGTYQREEERPVYGITTNIENKANPLHVNFHELLDIVTDVRKAKTLKEKLFFIFGDPEKVYRYKLSKANTTNYSENDEKNLPAAIIVPVVIPAVYKDASCLDKRAGSSNIN